MHSASSTRSRSGRRVALLLSILLLALATLATCQSADGAGTSDYQELVALFEDWRAFETPPMANGVPDYTAETFSRRHEELAGYRSRLEAIQISDWPIERQIDWHLLRAEMNGFDFHVRVLQPWVRDPAYYTSVWTFQSDTPAHEGPNHHALVELWTYDFPLDTASAEKLSSELATIPPLLEQARGNLTGNARELWIGGIENLRGQAVALTDLAATLEGGENHAAVEEARAAALAATESFVEWLEAEGETKTGPSGIGRENYTWHLQNVLLVPLTWEDEVRLLQRELARAWSSLKLEEHRNRELPPIRPIASAEEWDARAEESVLSFMRFLVGQEVLPAYDYLEGALRGQMGRFVPEEQRNFFWTVAHHEPLALWTHWYHWFDLARMESEPHESPLRRGPLLYNVWMSRSEGMSTGFEEMATHAGLFDKNPRARELMWIMLSQRAARGLGSLYAQANDKTLQEARDFHVQWTPRGWMREDLDLLGFEQLLYLRQPGYGTSYITGKYLIELLLAERTGQDPELPLRDFFAEVDDAGLIPASMVDWQLTGTDPMEKGALETMAFP